MIAHDAGIVIIGRNEGQRLRACLESAIRSGMPMVYVDSDSTDGSVELARQLGADTIALDMSKPFSAARARNAGWRHLATQHPQVRFVQFVDGDCEFETGWLETAHQQLAVHADWVAVCGRRRERYPYASIYNLACDLEWNTPCGLSRSVGGDAMFRMSALQATGGYRDDVIAGEEPELSVRLRQHGGQIWRLDCPMTLHDANITRFRAWWQRAKRGGYAFALGAYLHGAPPERHWVTEYRRAIAWGMLLPSVTLLAGIVNPIALAALLAYPLQTLRLAAKTPNFAPLKRLQLGALAVLAKFAEAHGCLRFWSDKGFQRQGTLIEYK